MASWNKAWNHKSEMKHNFAFKNSIGLAPDQKYQPLPNPLQCTAISAKQKGTFTH